MDKVDGVFYYICYITAVYILRWFQGKIIEVLMTSDL